MEVTEMSNKLVMSLINKFMVENEDDIMEFITNPEGELAQKWIEQGEAVKEYIGYKEPNKDGVVFRPPTIEDEVIRVIHKDTLDKIKRVHLRSIRRDKKNKRIEEETKRQANEVRKPLSLATLLRGEIV
jgi:hypothetical protein